jgi:glycosyltransferase involved in cell wall biosynthesis
MRQVAERLAAAGHDTTVVTSYLPERNFSSHNGVAIKQFKVSGNAIVGMRGEVGRYRDFILNFGADAILIKAAQQWTFDALWPILREIAARKVFIPCGFSGFYEKSFAAYFAQMPDVLREFDHLIFYAENYRDIDFARAHGLTHYSILPNGASELEFEAPVEADFRRRLGISDNAFVFLTVGNPIGGKGHSQIAEAFFRLETGGRPATLMLNGNWRGLPNNAAAMPGAALIGARMSAFRWINHGVGVVRRIADAIRGEGWAGFKMLGKTSLGRWWSTLRIHKWIERANAQVGKQALCTDLPRADVVQAFMTADLFVFASIAEYSPLVLFEAAAAGTPFLSVPVGNAEEIARMTGGGMICPAASDDRGYVRVDPTVLAREMERCMGDPDMLARVGARGKENWRRMFTWDAIAPRYESILAGRTGVVNHKNS